ncbi:MAG: cytochrome c5 family protein [Methylotenera sp. 24-45-7]|jgi:cytochrome c5|nr:MAG: cytochrome c5 family protein [Mehylophilales bacterium 35-46-6]OYY82999.1 MAG: cytochrome c5 family protein [Methylophilales bacterium 16-45-9]OYZ40795.1 MAG: cytochrome c5 family protein [Methylotenera sp. 24-45-7]OZA07609.1 MAG: cytochrome c5 family protein [Methylotenera sp. 17-45-7]OZA53739.1 MAG: cytochrome c5 family protein [Methylophilales bacterium 39-45-7]HQS37574.1 c-type cytochrome [Methylotenera sp.]
MSNVDSDKGYTFGQILLAAVAGVVGIALILVVWAKIFGVTDAIEVAEPTAAISKLEENIRPVAMVEVAEAGATGATEKTGEEVVKGVCAMCHAAGLMNSPKIGDKGQWQARIAQGYETLVKHAIEGIRSMPARGGNPSLTDSEVANAVAYMANQSGANFKETAPKAAEAAPVAEAPAAAPAVEAKAAEPVAVAAAPAVAAGKSGEDVYKAVCAMCHATGLLNAPKFGDKAQWEARIKQGYETLVTHANKGIRSMPAKGGNPSLSDDEVASAVKYMANASGAKF